MIEIKMKDYPKEQWSRHDLAMYNLTGHVPAHPDNRMCTSCGESGHYYSGCEKYNFFGAILQEMWREDERDQSW